MQAEERLKEQTHQTPYQKREREKGRGNIDREKLDSAIASS